MAHHMYSAPLVSILAIAVFVVVSGHPGGGLSYQGRDTTGLTTISWRRDLLFFGGRSSGSMRGALPFSTAENLRIGAMTAQARSGARKEKKEERQRRDR